MNARPNVNAERFPLLASFLALGAIRTDGYEYVGIAEDGVSVALGTLDDPESVEHYLMSRPSPDLW